jgi:phosphatidate cytidylyltransferase
MFPNLLINPLANPVTLPVILLLAVVFGGAGLALVTLGLASGGAGVGAVSRGKSRTPRRVLWQRYRTWAIIAPVFAGAALSGPLALAGVCAFIIWQGSREYAALANLTPLYRRALVLSGWATLGAVLFFGPAALPWTVVVAFFGWAALGILTPAGEQEAEGRNQSLMAGWWGYLYIGWLPAHLLALGLSREPGLVLVVGLGVALSDVGAFCAGKTIGGPKLAPRLSPNKTWGGVAGNLLGAALALALMAFALHRTPEWWQIGALALTIGLGSVWGDLLESLLKRQRGVKDAGGLLPGFGGLLDRVDSLLLVAPLVYYLSLLLF